MALDLVRVFESYDGRSVDPFRRVAEAVPAEPATLATLVDLCRGGRGRAAPAPAVQVGATWVLKALLEDGVAPDVATTRALLELPPRLTADDARLHVLQVWPRLALPDPGRAAGRRALEAAWDAARGLVDTRKTFVRAWAYNALGVLCAALPDRRREVEALYAHAAANEPASVRARVRHALRDL